MEDSLVLLGTDRTTDLTGATRPLVALTVV
jgi:hypothetical protein